MKPSIIGAGQIGRALADKWHAADRDVSIGVRNPSTSDANIRTVDIEQALQADVGFTPVWVGEGEQAANVIDGVTKLWFALAMGRGMGRHLGFRALA